MSTWRQQTLGLVAKAVPGCWGGNAPSSNFREDPASASARGLATVPFPPTAEPRRLPGGAGSGLGGGHDGGIIRRFQTAPARFAARGGEESSVPRPRLRADQLLRPDQARAGPTAQRFPRGEFPPRHDLGRPSEPSVHDSSRYQLALYDGAGGAGQGQFGQLRLRRDQLLRAPRHSGSSVPRLRGDQLLQPAGAGGCQFAASESSTLRLRHDQLLRPPGVLTNASDLGAKRLATSQLLVSGRRHEPDPDFGSGAGDWELHDEENADPATAARATARASRRGNALAPLPGTSSRKNAKRKFAGSDAGDDDGSSASSASDATLVEQPRRKKARYDLMELGFPPLSAKCKPSDGIEYCVGQQPLYEEGVSFAVPPLCRLAGCRETRCKKLGRGPAKDFFCASHYSEVTGKESRADLQGGGFPALALSKVPPGVDACVGKPPEKKKSGKYFQNYCRLAGCEKTRCKNQGKGPDCDHFCKSHFRDFALDQSQWKSAEKAWDGKEFPKLIHTSVPAGVDANVGKAPRRENGVLLCRLATCKRSKCRVPSQGKRCEYFCGGCHTRYLTANQEYAEEMEQLHARKVRDGDTINTTLRQHLLDQSFDAATDGDADVHLRENKLLFHFTAASSLDHWERNNAGEIQLKPNNQLKRATLNEHTPHWLKMSRKKREDGDDKVWTTPSFLGGWKFLADHHKCPPERGTVWHVLVIASDNSAYKTFGQHRWNGKDISQNHELMCDSAGRDVVPNLVLRVEFRDSNIKNAKMTVVRVNGDAANEVEIDAEDPRFKITEETISWSE